MKLTRKYLQALIKDIVCEEAELGGVDRALYDAVTSAVEDAGFVMSPDGDKMLRQFITSFVVDGIEEDNGDQFEDHFEKERRRMFSVR